MILRRRGVTAMTQQILKNSNCVRAASRQALVSDLGAVPVREYSSIASTKMDLDSQNEEN